MKIDNFAESTIKEEAVQKPSPLKVCMHIRGVARLDVRVMRAATTLHKIGYSVSVIDLESDCTRPREENIDGIQMKHIMLKPHWLKPSRLPWRLVKSIRKLTAAIFWLLQTPADIYHVHNENALLPCYLFAQIRRKPLLFESYEMPMYTYETTSHKWLRSLVTQLFIIMLRSCSGVITVSPLIIQEMYNRYGIAEVILVRNIPHYQEIPQSNKLREYLGLNKHVRIVLYQGNLQHDRNLENLVSAAKFLEKDIVIVLMGKDVGNTLSELKSLAEGEEVTDRLKFVPPVPNKELLYWTASADIGVNIASPEYSLNTRMFLPNKLFEYLMAGVPVLSSPLPAIVEVINTHEVGWVLPSLDPKEVGTKINAMLADYIGLERMQHNALEKAKNEFCWEQESQRLIGLYENVVGKYKELSREKKSFSLPKFNHFFLKRR
jgi:glycosyltransferase involved in cell wall biosynthesis